MLSSVKESQHLQTAEVRRNNLLLEKLISPMIYIDNIKFYEFMCGFCHVGGIIVTMACGF